MAEAKQKKPVKGDHVRILNTTMTGYIAVNERGEEQPYMVELDEQTMKNLNWVIRAHYEENYAGPFSADQLKIINGKVVR